ERTTEPVQRSRSILAHIRCSAGILPAVARASRPRSARTKSFSKKSEDRMAEEKNGKNGGKVGLLDRVKEKITGDVQALKTDIPTKAKEQIEGLKDPTKTQVYTSIFRHKHDETPRNRALGVLSNVFLHLHPAKINRDAVRYSYTWGMGGITFYLLPDDQLRFWAVTVGTHMARATPLLGHEGPFGPLLGMTPYNDVRFGLLGGSIVDANALLRSYIWHCIGIPIVASVLMIVHFW